MPTPPSVYFAGYVSPQQLNTDMYSYDGTGFGANGILYHSHVPALQETLIAPGTAYAAVSQQAVSSGNGEGYTVIDTTALFSSGADFPGPNAAFTFENPVPGSGGAAGTVSGYWLTWGFPYSGLITAPPGGVGAGVILGTAYTTGVFQYGSTAHNNCPWYLDILNAGSGFTYHPAFWWLSGSTPAPVGNSSDTSGQTCRMGWLWKGVSQGGSTVGTVPVPQLSWGTVTSAALNNNSSILSFLNNPPLLKVVTSAGQSFGNAAATIVGLHNTPTIDNYSGWSTALSNYTVPLPGYYLFCPTIVWGTASAANIRYSGLETIAGGTTVMFQGPAYQATPVGPGASGVGLTATAVARVFNFSTGDRVAAFGFQNSGVSLSLYTGLPTRLIGAYMSQAAPAGSVYTLAAPDTSFRWQAGALSGTALTAALNTHLGNDLQFLMNKPYFTGYQQTAQSGFASSSGFHQVNIDTLGAPPRGGNGDNYGGWSTANSWYVSQLAGWYLCIADLYATTPVSGTVGTLSAGFSVSSSGGIVPSSTPDWYQQVVYPVATGGAPPGVTAIGLYYLSSGEHIAPVMQAQSWGGNWGTFTSSSTGATVFSQFSCFWVAE